MDKLIKSLSAENGTLYVTSAGQRIKLARFKGSVKIWEHQTLIPVLGTVQKGVKRIYASFIVCGEIDYQIDPIDDLIHSGKVYDAEADVLWERIQFSGLRLTDSDPILNTLTFEVADLELVRKLAM